MIRDLPAVGRNLQDHPDIFMIYELTGAHSYDKYKKLNWKAWAGLAIRFVRYRSDHVERL